MITTADTLPLSLHTPERAGWIDRDLAGKGLRGRVLMERAGYGALVMLEALWPAAATVNVFCGGGNNGGDGAVLARLLRQRGKKVRVLAPPKAPKTGLAAEVWGEMISNGVAPVPGDRSELPDDADVTVDALLGIGLDKPVEGVWLDRVRAINRSRSPVLALDVPSGLSAATGAPLGEAVRADATLTFIVVKIGLLTGAGVEYTGRLFCDDLRVPEEWTDVEPAATRLTWSGLASALPGRRRDAHKGHNGHVLVLGGAPGYGGAVLLAARAAARVGAGLVTVGAQSDPSVVLGSCPELMTRVLRRPNEPRELLRQATVCAIGPGLGVSSLSASWLRRAMRSPSPLVVDADGLNLLARAPESRRDWIITPHPGEAARLLGVDTESAQSDRVAAAKALRDKYGAVVVLKGAGTLVVDDDGVGLVSTGNPGMASGGMGDLLTGIIAGLVAQGVPLGMAARLGACLHATAGDAAAAADGERGLLASDLLPWVRRLANH